MNIKRPKNIVIPHERDAILSCNQCQVLNKLDHIDFEGLQKFISKPESWIVAKLITAQFVRHSATKESIEEIMTMLSYMTCRMHAQWHASLTTGRTG